MVQVSKPDACLMMWHGEKPDFQSSSAYMPALPGTTWYIWGGYQQSLWLPMALNNQHWSPHGVSQATIHLCLLWKTHMEKTSNRSHLLELRKQFLVRTMSVGRKKGREHSCQALSLASRTQIPARRCLQKHFTSFAICFQIQGESQCWNNQ